MRLPPAFRPTLFALALALVAAACSGSRAAMIPATSPAPRPPSTTAAPAATSTTTTAPLPPETCPTFRPKVLARTTDAMRGVTAMAVSRRNAPLLWFLDHDADGSVLYAATEDLRVVSTLHVPGIGPASSLAIAPGPGGEPWIYIADLADPTSSRRSVDVAAFPEPTLGDTPPAQLDAVGVVHSKVTYSSGPADAAAFTVDSRTGEAVIVAKALDNDRSAKVLSVPSAQLRAGGTARADLLGSVVAAIDAKTGPTDVTVSPDGTLVAMKNPVDSFLWLRQPDVGLGELLVNAPVAPCEVDFGSATMLAFNSDASSLYALEPGVGKPLRRYGRSG